MAGNGQTAGSPTIFYVIRLGSFSSMPVTVTRDSMRDKERRELPPKIGDVRGG